MRIEKLINDEGTLNELIAALSDAPLVAIDTEFVRESTYFPQLCLVQLATEKFAACVDLLSHIDVAPLFACLSRDDCTWLLHSGTQDLEVLWLHAHARPGQLIDTQIAAALLGHAAQIGLQELLSQTLGVDIGKGFTRTDWSRRPLPDGALLYALDDVRHLLSLWRELEKQLEGKGRLEWVLEDSRRLLQSAAATGLHGIWGRLKSVHGLDADTRAAALALVRWRERAAQSLNRPRRWIMSDELLVRLAQLRPQTVGDVEAVSDMPGKLASRFGAELVAAVASRRDPELVTELDALAPGDRPDKDALRALQQRVRQRASQLGLQGEVLASRRDLAALLGGDPPEHLRSGWRAEQLQLAADAPARLPSAQESPSD